MRLTPFDYLEILKLLHNLTAEQLRAACGEANATAGSDFHAVYWREEYMRAHRDFFQWLCHQHPTRYARLIAEGAKLGGFIP